MQEDWFFAFPLVSLTEAEPIVAEWIASDPAAADISDREAEEFVAAGVMLRAMNRKTLALLSRFFGLRISYTGEKAIRRATFLVLRRWNEPKVREKVLFVLPNTGLGRYPDPAMGGAAWTEELFAAAYRDGQNIMWLVQVRRHLGKAENLTEWLEGLGTEALRRYRLWLNVGRLTLRRIVYGAPSAAGPGSATATAAPASAEPPEVAAAAQVALERDLAEKDRASGALRQDVRRLERDRKQLKERARRQRLQALAQVSQARGDVAAARKAAQERLAAQARELADQARQFEAELRALRGQITAARAEFVRIVSDLAAHSRLDVLAGRTVMLAGDAGDRELYRLLVETLGGRLVPEGGEVALSAPAGCAALERQLRRLAMQRVLIKCDGLYRRKEGRPGVAIAGFQVHIGNATVCAESAVVSCGPWAGSLMAEYGAAVMALAWLAAADPAPGSQLEVWSDCRSLLSRLRRKRPVRRKVGCVILDTTIRRLVRQLEARGCQVRFQWVPRDEVYAVDRLCARAYFGLTWYHRPQRRPKAAVESFLRAAVGDVRRRSRPV